MAKDPAVLFYIDKWLAATAGMSGDVRGWYLNLILHQYDKGPLPNDTEELAQLAGVRHSEFDRFKQMLEQVLKQKFKQNDEGMLENDMVTSILKSRELFKEKRAKSGNIGVIIKLAKTIKGYNTKYLDMLKNELYSFDDEKIEEAKNKQVLEQMLKLYINTNTSRSKDKSIEDEAKTKAVESFANTQCTFSSDFKNVWLQILQEPKWRNKTQSAVDQSLKSLMKYDEVFAISLVESSIAGNWQGVVFQDTDIKYSQYQKVKGNEQRNNNSGTGKSESRARLADLAKQVLAGNGR